MYYGSRTLLRTAGISALLFLLIVSHAAASGYSIINISDPDIDAVSAVLSGDHVIYAGIIGDGNFENATRVVQLYSLADGSQARLAVSDPGFSITGEDIDGDYAVWFSEPGISSTQDGPNRVYLWSITKQDLTVIRTQPGAEWPKIAWDTVIWSESSGDSMGSQVMQYDIPSGKTAPVPNVSTIDPAGVSFNGRHILYSDADTMALRLYTVGTGSESVVFAPVEDNNTHAMPSGYVLGSDYVLYRKDVRVDNPREMYSELCLYTISTGKTVLISPLAGTIVTNLSDSDKNAAFNVGAADEGRVVWYVTKGIADDRIMVLGLPAMSQSTVSPKESVYSISIDDRTMAWKGSDQLFGKGTIYLATETGGEEGTAAESSPAPTKSPLPAFVAIAGIFLSVLFARGRVEK